MAGSHLAEYLLAAEPEWQLFGPKRQSAVPNNLQAVKHRVTLLDCNLLDTADCTNLVEAVRPDVIFHLAALSCVRDSWANARATLCDNITMQLNVLDSIRQAQLDPIVHVALSSEEYGKVASEELPISEKNPFRPLSPYGVSKVAQDMLAYQYYQSYGLRIIRTRAFNHEGPRRPEMFVTSNFAKQIAEIEAGLKPAKLFVGNLAAKRDFSDVRDVVKAYYLATKHCVPGEDYVIASGSSHSIADVLEILLGFSKVPVEVIEDPSRMRPSDVDNMLGDPTKFKKATGWEPRYSLTQTLEDLLNEWRKRIVETKSESLIANRQDN
jgi:GDP-4-dehydro-6-deoxy-D-mannose reductase